MVLVGKNLVRERGRIVVAGAESPTRDVELAKLLSLHPCTTMLDSYTLDFQVSNEHVSGAP